MLLIKIGCAITLATTIIWGGGGWGSCHQAAHGEVHQGAGKDGQDCSLHVAGLEDKEGMMSIGGIITFYPG